VKTVDAPGQPRPYFSCKPSYIFFAEHEAEFPLKGFAVIIYL
jgi:hypothetical protein